MKAAVQKDGEEVRHYDTSEILKREPDGLWVPYRTIRDEEGITLGFRQEMVALNPEGEGDVSGSVCTGTGLGSDFIIFQLDNGDESHAALMRGSELLKRWVRSFDPEAAERIPGVG